MVLFRALEWNRDEHRMAELKNALHVALSQLDVAFRWGAIGTTRIPVRYLALPEANGQQLGWQLMISFWAWGNAEADTMHNLARVIQNLARALRGIATHGSPESKGLQP